MSRTLPTYCEHDAADRYRAIEECLAEAREWSSLLRQAGPGYAREARAANQAALDARQALEHARDGLVAAALDHTAIGVSRQDLPEEGGSYIGDAA